jgi:hypothetical protein
MIVGYCLIREFLGIFEAACVHPDRHGAFTCLLSEHLVLHPRLVSITSVTIVLLSSMWTRLYVSIGV